MKTNAGNIRSAGWTQFPRTAVCFSAGIFLSAMVSSTFAADGTAATTAAPAAGAASTTASADPQAHLDYAPGQAPKFWSVAAAETVMARWPDFTKAYFNGWTYVNGYELYGFEMLYRATGDKKYFDYTEALH